MTEALQNTYCVIGDPIEHSLSPEIHNFVFSELDLPLQYEAVRVPTDMLQSFIQESRELKRPGWNVTIPNKQAIIPFLDEIDPLARRIRAVNTVLNRNGKLIGLNTDVYGCRTSLERGGWSPNGKVILLGAGGAARAVIASLASMGVRDLILFDLIIERAKDIQLDFMKILDMTITIGNMNKGDLENELDNVDLLVNATPVGMWPKNEESPVPCPEWIPQNTTVFDLVYKPINTRLLQQSRSRGAHTISGLTMLIAQALASDEIWLNRKLPESLFEKVLEHISKILEEDE
ncbi:shikimate dehydrogenase [bacterium]|nr:shikimate dehydrogenase [bacterium]